MSWFKRVWYSTSEGVSALSSTAVATFQLTGEIISTVAVGTGAFVFDKVKAYIFQGTVIEHGPHGHDHKPPKQSDDETPDEPILPRVGSRTSIQSTGTTYSSVSSTPEEKATKSCCTTFRSVIAQLSYNIGDLGLISYKRYLVQWAAWSLFVSNPISTPFLIYQAACLLLAKFPFILTNETYEPTQKIAEHFEGEGALPYYSYCCLPCSGKRGRRALKIIGVFDHLVNDHEASMLATIPPEVIDFLIDSLKSAPGVAGPIVGLLALPVLYLMYKITKYVAWLTYLFEGQHTDEHLREIAKDFLKKNFSFGAATIKKHKLKLTVQQAQDLKAGLKYMSLVHGIDSGVAPYVALQYFIKNPWFKWPSAIVAGLFFGAGSAIGTKYSEVAEAEAALDEIINRGMSHAPKPHGDKDDQKKTTQAANEEQTGQDMDPHRHVAQQTL